MTTEKQIRKWENIKCPVHRKLSSNAENTILEPYILGTEPYNFNKINVIDTLGSIKNNSISGTGGLLE